MIKRLVRLIPLWEAHASFGQQIWAVLSALGLVGATGLLTGWAGAASAWLEVWGPIGYVAAGLAGALAASVCLALMGLWRQQMARARFIAKTIVTPATINPLQTRFERQRFKLNDLENPFSVVVDNKEFLDCEIIGHGAAMFRAHTTVLRPSIVGCDLALLKKNVRIETFIVFQNCRFINCRFLRITIMVHPDVASHFPSESDANWITSR